MLGQQERLHGADLSYVQKAIDASRAAKRARTQYHNITECGPRA